MIEARHGRDHHRTGPRCNPKARHEWIGHPGPCAVTLTILHAQPARLALETPAFRGG